MTPAAEAPKAGSAAEAGSPVPPPKRGVPVAPFVANVSEFVGGREVEGVLKGLEEGLQQYRMLDLKMVTQQKDLQSKIPEIKKSLEVVKRLQQHQGSGAEDALVADFEVSEGIFAKATIESAQSVCLWLGANVMLEYSVKEALDLLDSNLLNASASLEALQRDIDFLRDQINTTELTIARVHNWDLKRRRQRQT